MHDLDILEKCGKSITAKSQEVLRANPNVCVSYKGKPDCRQASCLFRPCWIELRLGLAMTPIADNGLFSIQQFYVRNFQNFSSNSKKFVPRDVDQRLPSLNRFKRQDNLNRIVITKLWTKLSNPFTLKTIFQHV